MGKSIFAKLLCIVVLGLTMSCSKDSDDLIVGEWELSHYVWSYYLDYNEYHIQTDEAKGVKLKLTEDGLFEVKKGSASNVGFGNGTGNYILKEGYLIFDDILFFWEKKYQIEKLTNKELILSYFDDSDSPDPVENTIKVHTEFKRI